MKIPTKSSLLKKQRVFKVILLTILLFCFLVIIFFPKPSPSIKIPQENVAKTSNWKIYENKEYYFSFKYPDVLLSNFQVSTSNSPSESLKKMSQLKESQFQLSQGKIQSNSYNVIFEANGWKYTDTLDKFLSDGPFKDIKNYDKQTIILNNLSGLRISNVKMEKKSDVYFYYNLFKKGNYIYNFSLITDDPLLIVGNARLLDDIMSTAKFND